MRARPPSNARPAAALLLTLAGCGGKVLLNNNPADAATADASPDAGTPDGAAPDVTSPGCPRSQVRCGAACVDPVLNPFHCGGCGVACGAGDVCFGGTCVRPCVAPRLQCGAGCFDGATDPNHCGGCDRACGPEGTCRAGRCRLPTDVTYFATRDQGAADSWVDACAAPGHENLVPSIDDSSAPTRLPFDFPFWGTTLRANSPVNVCSNGWIGLDGASNNALSGALPDATAPNGVVAARWVDLVTGTSGVCVATVGDAGSRRFVAEWNDVTFYGARSVHATFEIVLHERDGLIELLYPNNPPRAQGTGGLAGVESLDGLDGVSLCNPSGDACPEASGARAQLRPSR